MPIRLLLTLALVGILAGAACAEDATAPQVVGLNTDAARKFAEAKKKVEDKKYGDALDDFQALINTAGNDLIPLSTDHYVQIRWLCHRAIADLPANALKTYRQRVEAQARKLLEQAGEPGDERLLRKLVEEHFCSRPAEMALHRLGDLAFERGRFAEADRWWQHLLKEERDGPVRLVYPDPEGKPAVVKAKILLSRWFRNDRAAWKLELDLFRKQYPNAEGPLAGRTGKLVELLEQLTAAEKDPVQAARQWTTFAGNPQRSVILPDEPTRPAALARLSRRGEYRQIPLGALSAFGGKVVSVAEAARTLAFHPVIVEGQVLVSDARYVTGYDLKTGKKEVWFDAVTELGNFEARRELPAPADLRYTLSVADDCVLARLGAQEIGPAKDAPTCIVCLERTPGKRLRWKAKLDSTGGPAYFEGTPVVNGRSCYVAITRFSGGHTLTSIHCYPLDVRGTATPRWTREICKTRELQGKESRTRHHLLTVAGPNVVYCSHSGTIVALDADTGRRAWGVRYQGKSDKTSRDLVPCVYGSGRVFAAPADVNRLLALDALTGELLWDRDGIEVQQMLGVAQGRLLFTTLTPRAGLRAVGVATGTETIGWFQPGDGGSLPTFGQGLLAGERVYWPTAERVYVLNQADGQVPEDPTQLKRIPSGNIAFGEGCLAVADRTTLHVFTPPALDVEGKIEGAAALQQHVARCEGRDQVAEAVALCQELLNDPDVRGQKLRDERGLWQTARNWAGWRIDNLIARHGRDVYAAIEKEAVESLEKPGTRLERLRSLADQYPHADVTHKHLLELAALEEKAGEPGHAALTYRQWLRRPSSGDERARVQAQLARLTANATNGTPALELPLQRDWHHDGKGALVLASSGPFFCEQGGGAFDLAHRRLWPDKLQATPTWVGHEGEIAVLGSAHEVRATLLHGGADVWRYPSEQPLSEFITAGGRVFALAQQRRILAFDAFTGQLLWQRDAPAAFRVRPLPGGRFEKLARATDRFVFARLGNGHLWKLDAATGEVLADEPASPIDTVRLCDPTSGTVRWSHTIEGRSTLNGEAPCLICRGEQTLLLTGRNYAHTLQRLDAATGKPVWEREVLLGEPVDPRSLSADARACYFVHERQLKALALADGKPLWTFPLPATARTWRTVRTGDTVIAWPIESAGVRFHFRTPLGSLEWRMERGWEDRPGEGLPVLLLDAASGKLVQRLNLLIPPGPVEVRLRGWWDRGRLPAFAPPQVVVHAGGLVVVAGTQAWGFKPLPDGPNKRD